MCVFVAALALLVWSLSAASCWFIVAISSVFCCSVNDFPLCHYHNRLVNFKLILVSVVVLRFYDGVFPVRVIISLK